MSISQSIGCFSAQLRNSHVEVEVTTRQTVPVGLEGCDTLRKSGHVKGLPSAHLNVRSDAWYLAPIQTALNPFTFLKTKNVN